VRLFDLPNKKYMNYNNLTYFKTLFIFITFVSILIGQYPISPSMLSKYDSKYYLKHNGNLYSGSIIEMSKRSWKKVLETNLINGLIDGVYKEWYPNGVLKYEGMFVNGQRQGLFHSWYPSGKKKNERKYKDNVLDSVSVSFLENGMMEKRHNHDTDEALIYDYSDFPKSLITYSEQFGKLNGVYTKWDNFGRKIEQGFYHNNKKDSIWYKYNLSGEVYEKGRFEDDQKDGIWLNYDDFGRESVKSYYTKDNLDSIKNIVYYMNGSEYVVKNYKLKDRQNLIITYSENGNKIGETQYIGSNLTGQSIKWFDNGQKEYQLNFLDNRLNGIAEYWNQDGSKKKSGEFKNGRIIGEWTYYDDPNLISD